MVHLVVTLPEDNKIFDSVTHNKFDKKMLNSLEEEVKKIKKDDPINNLEEIFTKLGII